MEEWDAPGSFLSNFSPLSTKWVCSHMSDSHLDSEWLLSGTQARAASSLTCIRVRSDSTYDCSVSSRVMVTCFRMSWGDRRQRMSSALFLSRPPPSVTRAQRAHPCPLPGLQGLSSPQSTLDPHSAGLCSCAPPAGSASSCNSNACLPGLCPSTLAPLLPSPQLLADLEFSCLLLGSPVGLLKITPKNPITSHICESQCLQATPHSSCQL